MIVEFFRIGLKKYQVDDIIYFAEVVGITSKNLINRCRQL